ncbi:MAG: hypothetical protein SWK90_11325 [Chloroflexota bacterium]|nr:hypothetical protein [Chloroflexota bacterium]
MFGGSWLRQHGRAICVGADQGFMLSPIKGVTNLEETLHLAVEGVAE